MIVRCFCFLLSCSLFIACGSSEPIFPSEKILFPESDMNYRDSIEIKLPYLILQKKCLLIDSVYYVRDSLLIADAVLTTSAPSMEIEYFYTDPNMKRVYVSDDRVVYCYGYKKQIDFMDFRLNLIKRIHFKSDNSVCFDLLNVKHAKLSYVCSYLGKRYYYALFLGKTLEEYRHSSEAFLEVYDLDGNPVVRYCLKNSILTYFSVDEESFVLYGFDVNKKYTDKLLIYNLKGLF